MPPLTCIVSLRHRRESSELPGLRRESARLTPSSSTCLTGSIQPAGWECPWRGFARVDRGWTGSLVRAPLEPFGAIGLYPMDDSCADHVRSAHSRHEPLRFPTARLRGGPIGLHADRRRGRAAGRMREGDGSGECGPGSGARPACVAPLADRPLSASPMCAGRRDTRSRGELRDGGGTVASPARLGSCPRVGTG